MSTPPTPELPILTLAGSVSRYLKVHETLLFVVIGVALFWFLSGKVQDVIAAHDSKVYAAKVAELQVQATANAAQNAANVAAASAFQQQAAQATQQIAALQKETLSILATLAQQKESDKHLPAPALAARIETLAAIPTGSVTPTPNETFTVTQEGAVGIATTLENVPALQSQLENANSEKAVADALLATQTGRVDGLNLEVTGLQSQIALADGVCKAEIKVVKDAAAKSRRKWMIAVYVAGLATRGAIKLFTGI